ncbi:hypothetical protein FTUN_6887 [Frigoriglobus tundricola]|uniref:Tetratricopeptide repeat protein n=1 Tax=Frigoriglobus tundricola TaxID=2774151 RepID=A0A6M5YZA3_9BACT|nr:hypothetical protein FTUN_6887 [Frigoriglobus tundricola]
MIVAAAGLVAYSNCYQGQPFLDDFRVLGDLATEAVGPDGWVPRLLDRRWLGNWSFVIGFVAFGDGLPAVHAVNVAVHIAAAIVLWALVVRTLRLPVFRGRFADRAGGLATAVAALWVVHPLTTSAVTYLTQRYESQMGLFVLVAVWCVLRGATATYGRVGWYAAAVASAYAASVTKEPAVVVPAVVAVYDRLFLAGSWRAVVRERWPVHLGLLAVQAVFLPFALSTRGAPPPTAPEAAPLVSGSEGTGRPDAAVVSAGFSATGVTAWAYLRSQPGVILHYLRLSVVPRPLVLDYAWPVATGWWSIWPPGAVVVGLLGVTMWGVVRGAGWSVLGVWFFGFLAVTSSFVPIIDLAFEHRMYLPLAAVVAGVVLLGDWVLDGVAACTGWQTGRLKFGALGAAVLVLTALTYARNEDYHDEVRMYQKTLESVPDNDRVWNNLGAAHLVRGRDNEAAAAFREATRHPSPLKPFIHDLAWRNWLTVLERSRREELVLALTEYVAEEPEDLSRRFKLAQARVESRDAAGAVAEYRAAIGTATRTGTPLRDPMVFAHYAQALSDSGDPEAALAAAGRALDLRPDLPAAHNRMGQDLMRLGRYAEADPHFRTAAERQPQAPNGPQNLAVLRMYQGRPAEAVPMFREALRRDQKSVPALLGLAHALGESGQPVEARRAFGAAGQLAPDWPQKTVERAWRMSTHGDPRARYAAEGLRLARQVVAGVGDRDPGALDTLAAALAENGQFEGAERTARQAVEIARADGHIELANEIEGRRALYARRQPYRQPEPASR